MENSLRYSRLKTRLNLKKKEILRTTLYLCLCTENYLWNTLATSLLHPFPHQHLWYKDHWWRILSTEQIHQKNDMKIFDNHSLQSPQVPVKMYWKSVRKIKIKWKWTVNWLLLPWALNSHTLLCFYSLSGCQEELFQNLKEIFIFI